MYQNETPVWPEEAEWRMTEAWLRGKHIAPSQQVFSLTPVEMLVSASLLMRPTDDESGYQFSHQRICEQVLKRHLKALWNRTDQSAEAASGLLSEWLDKAERFDWLANAISLLLVEWLHGPEAEFLPLVFPFGDTSPGAMEIICTGFLMDMLDMESVTSAAGNILQQGIKIPGSYSIMSQSVFEIYRKATTSGRTRPMLNIVRVVSLAMQELVRLEPERTDFRMDLAMSYWNMFRICLKEDEEMWLTKTAKILEELKKANKSHNQLDQLWDMVSGELEKRVADIPSSP